MTTDYDAKADAEFDDYRNDQRNDEIEDLKDIIKKLIECKKLKEQLDSVDKKLNEYYTSSEEITQLTREKGKLLIEYGTKIDGLWKHAAEAL